MKQVYAEMGIGNETFLSTEIEEGGHERRIKGFHLPKKITDVYVRIWVGKRVMIVSTKDGVKFVRKEKQGLKILVGVGGEM